MSQAANDVFLARQRIVDWQDPRAVRVEAHGLNGLEIMRGIRDQSLPPPPMARLVGFHCVKAEPGEIVMELQPEESLENTIGLLHGGVAATMLDTAMGAAVGTLLPADKGTVTLDLKLTYLRPLTIASGSIRAIGRAKDIAGRIGYAEGELVDEAGNIAVRGVGLFSVIGSQQKLPISRNAKVPKQSLRSAFKEWFSVMSA